MMMKRDFCWETDDILYISLKSRSRSKPKAPTSQELQRNERIMKMNWADQVCVCVCVCVSVSVGGCA